MANTLFDKIWDKHVVQIVDDGPTQLYIDRLYCQLSPFAAARYSRLEMFAPEADFLYARP